MHYVMSLRRSTHFASKGISQYFQCLGIVCLATSTTFAFLTYPNSCARRQVLLKTNLLPDNIHPCYTPTPLLPFMGPMEKYLIFLAMEQHGIIIISLYSALWDILPFLGCNAWSIHQVRTQACEEGKEFHIIYTIATSNMAFTQG